MCVQCVCFCKHGFQSLFSCFLPASHATCYMPMCIHQTYSHL